LYPGYCGSPVTAQQPGHDRLHQRQSGWGSGTPYQGRSHHTRLERGYLCQGDRAGEWTILHGTGGPPEKQVMVQLTRLRRGHTVRGPTWQGVMVSITRPPPGRFPNTRFQGLLGPYKITSRNAMNSPRSTTPMSYQCSGPAQTAEPWCINSAVTSQRPQRNSSTLPLGTPLAKK
jgi:hypothetical protein